MDLALITNIVLGVLLLLFAVGGAVRGFWPEVVTMAGVLLGGLLTEQWADAWGTDLSESFGLFDPDTSRFIVRLVLFLIPLLFIGYGGAIFLPSGSKLDARTRALGVLIGLLNGAAILGFLLRAYQYTFNDAAADSVLMIAPVSRILLEWAGWWVLVLALGGSVAVIVGLITRSGRNRPAPLPPITTEAPPALEGPLGPIGGTSTATNSTNGPRPLVLDDTLPSRPSLSDEPITTAPTRPSASTAEPRPGPSDVTTVVPVATNPSTSSTTTTTPPRGATPARCRTCGRELLPGAAFCTNCGTPVE